MTKERAGQRLANYIRIYRRRAGLTQHELEQVLGYGNEGSVSRHERFQATPPLKTAIGYEIVFHTPVAEIFAGLRDALAEDIEARLDSMEEMLGQRSATDRYANATARKLMWLAERKSSEEPEPFQ